MTPCSICRFKTALEVAKKWNQGCFLAQQLFRLSHPGPVDAEQSIRIGSHNGRLSGLQRIARSPGTYFKREVTMKAHPGEPLWAITSYFNPAKYKRRLENYRIFRASLSVPLVTVEHSHCGEFELDDGDADILCQVGGGDILWQREGSLNVALSLLPDCCDSIAWLDCDVIFENGDWPELTRQALDKFAIVQPFDAACDFARGIYLADARKANLIPTRTSFAYKFCSRTLTSAMLPTAGATLAQTLCAGFAWATRKQLLTSHGLYDAFVVGSGARALALVAIGEMDASIRGWQLNEKEVSHYTNWARPFFNEVHRNVGFVEGKVFHLWHGEIEHRRYGQRHVDFKKFGFDPYNDI